MVTPEKESEPSIIDLDRWRYWECNDCGISWACKYVQVPGRMEPSFCPATQAVCRWHEHVLPIDLEPRYVRLEEKITHMLAGHKYLLSEIRQLRETVKVLVGAIEGTKLQPAMDAIAAVQVMMGSLVQTWGPVQQALTEVAGAVKKLSVMTGQIQENVARAKIVGK